MGARVLDPDVHLTPLPRPRRRGAGAGRGARRQPRRLPVRAGPLPGPRRARRRPAGRERHRGPRLRRSGRARWRVGLRLRGGAQRRRGGPGRRDRRGRRSGRGRDDEQPGRARRRSRRTTTSSGSPPTRSTRSRSRWPRRPPCSIDWTDRLRTGAAVDHASAHLLQVHENKYYADLSGTRTTQQRVRVHPGFEAMGSGADTFDSMASIAPPVGRGWEYLPAVPAGTGTTRSSRSPSCSPRSSRRRASRPAPTTW